jgi:hypothetical protein
MMVILQDNLNHEYKNLLQRIAQRKGRPLERVRLSSSI